ncbi:mitochondrial import inner membrane translocase subunit TIM50-like [Hordeum vulgare]|nr:mitochondrial import inner membrane translocase subunit TIM50-like [Hordeum vulgare]
MRPGVETFLQHISTMYEVVVYSDQLEIDVEHVVKMIDKTGRVHTFSRHATKYRKGTHFRDLSKLNRNPARVLYMSAHALESCLQPENCLTIKSWTPETDDTELLDLIPFLEYFAVYNPFDIREVVAVYQGHDIVQMLYEECKEIESMLSTERSCQPEGATRNEQQRREVDDCMRPQGCSVVVDAALVLRSNGFVPAAAPVPAPGNGRAPARSRSWLQPPALHRLATPVPGHGRARPSQGRGRSRLCRGCPLPAPGPLQAVAAEATVTGHRRKKGHLILSAVSRFSL